MAKARREVVKPALVAAIDFDDTIVSEGDGRIIPGAKEALTYLKGAGWRIIIWTHRSDLDKVEAALKKFKIPYDHINEDPEHDNPGASRKVYFNVTVDDKAIPFNGNWANVVNEMENRRAGKARLGKVSVMSAKNESPIAVFSIHEGVAVEETGTTSKAISAMMAEGIEFEDGRTVFPGDGEIFLKALSQLRGTYLWAEAY